MLNTLQRHRARKLEDQTESGFTLIELLIVIVVLGVLAAVTVFALTNITGKSAVSACNSDASSVNSAIQAYEAQNPGSIPTLTDLTTADAGGTVYLQTVPTKSHYIITVKSGAVMVQAPASVTLANAQPFITPGVAAAGNVAATSPVVNTAACAGAK